MISNEFVIISEKSQLKSLDGVVLMISLCLISMNGIGQIKNLFLSEVTMCKLVERSSETSYKKISFLYLVVMGFLVFFFN